MARFLLVLAVLQASSFAYRMNKPHLALNASLDDFVAPGSEIHEGNHTKSSFLELIRRNLAWKAVPGPDSTSREAAGNGQGDLLLHFPPWAVNLYSFVLKRAPLAFVMCACAFFCFLATGRKPDHLDYLGVLANLFMFELAVLLVSGAVHCWAAGSEAPHFLAKLVGITLFGCGTVVNIWWLAWQTVRKAQPKPSPFRAAPAAEGAQRSVSPKPFRAASSKGGDAVGYTRNTGGLSPTTSAEDAPAEGSTREEQVWNSDAFGPSSFGATAGGGASFTRPKKERRGGR